MDGEPFPHDLAMGHRLRPEHVVEQLRAMGERRASRSAPTPIRTPTLARSSIRRSLHHEIVAADEQLQEALGRSVRYFAFPYGQPVNLSPAAFALAKEAGYAGVCSAYGGFNFPGDDPFHLQRIAADGVMIRLKNWVTMDPRKLRTPRFEYQGVGGFMPQSDGRGSGERRTAVKKRTQSRK